MTALTALREGSQDAHRGLAALTRAGAAGVIRSGKDVQVVVGTKAELIATEMKRIADL